MRRAVHIRALAAAIVAVAVAGCGSSSAPTTHATTPPGATSTSSTTGTAGGSASAAMPCSAGQLTPAYVGSNGATGHVLLTIALRNTSPRPCRIAGYPAARLLGAGDRPLPLRAGHGPGFFPGPPGPPHRVIIAPGSSAHYEIVLQVNNEYAGAHVCRRLTGMLAALPGRHAHRWRRISLSRAPGLSPCGNRMTVTAIHA